MSNTRKDDYFEETKMSFGQHLEELRVVLFRSLFGLIAGFLIGLLIADDVVEFFQIPIKDALDSYYLTKAKDDIKKKYGEVPPEIEARISEDELVPVDELIDPKAILECLKMASPEFSHVQYDPSPFLADDLPLANVKPLSKKLVAENSTTGTPARRVWQSMTTEQQAAVRQIAAKASIEAGDQQALLTVLNAVAADAKVYQAKEFEEVPDTIDQIRENLAGDDPLEIKRLNKLLIAGAFSDQIQSPRVPLMRVPIWRPTEVSLQALSAHETFMIWIKAAFISGLVIASPWIFYQIWLFVAAGLYPHEKNYVYIYVPFSIILFLGGAAMAFFLVFEPVLDFLFSFNRRMDIDPDPRIGEWLSFVLFLPLGFGVAFQLPLVMLFIHRIGIVSLDQYLQKWRIAILVIFVASMFLTPADPISMLMLALPLTVLYFLGVALCKWMPKGRNPFSEAYEP